MTITPGFTAEEIVGFVRAYEQVPHGFKGVWLKEQSFSVDQFRRWRRAYDAGDLERGLVPRQMPSRAASAKRARIAEDEVERVRAEARMEIEELKAAHLVELASRDAQITMLEAGNVTLGKAIGLLQNLN